MSKDTPEVSAAEAYRLAQAEALIREFLTEIELREARCLDGRARRAAKRAGLVARKSRRHLGSIDNFGGIVCSTRLQTASLLAGDTTWTPPTCWRIATRKKPLARPRLRLAARHRTRLKHGAGGGRRGGGGRGGREGGGRGGEERGEGGGGEEEREGGGGEEGEGGGRGGGEGGGGGGERKGGRGGGEEEEREGFVEKNTQATQAVLSSLKLRSSITGVY